jgi:hypothetical protein
MPGSTAEESNALQTHLAAGQKKACPSPLIYPHTVAMTQTTNAWLEMSESGVAIDLSKT